MRLSESDRFFRVDRYGLEPTTYGRSAAALGTRLLYPHVTACLTVSYGVAISGGAFRAIPHVEKAVCSRPNLPLVCADFRA